MKGRDKLLHRRTETLSVLNFWCNSLLFNSWIRGTKWGNKMSSSQAYSRRSSKNVEASWRIALYPWSCWQNRKGLGAKAWVGLWMLWHDISPSRSQRKPGTLTQILLPPSPGFVCLCYLESWKSYSGRNPGASGCDRKGRFPETTPLSYLLPLSNFSSFDDSSTLGWQVGGSQIRLTVGFIHRKNHTSPEHSLL